MSYFLLCLSLIIIPTINSFALTAFLPALSQPRAAQEFAAILFIILIFLTTKRHDIKPGNKFLYALLVFIPISIFSAPPVKLAIGNENIGGYWMWKAFFWVLAYFLLYWSILNMAITERRKQNIFSIISWVAVFNAVYVFIQALGFDQWQAVKTSTEIGNPLVPHLTGTIGNPTYCAIFLAACLPFVIIRKDWLKTAAVVFAIALCRSDFGNASIILAFVLPFMVKRPALLYSAIGLGVMLILAAWTIQIEDNPKIASSSNGRIAVWKLAYNDWKSVPFQQEVKEDMSQKDKEYVQLLNKKTYALTGMGIGSFRFLFTNKHNSRFETAHNEFLEILYSLGLIGLFLFVGALGIVFYNGLAVAGQDSFAMACYVACGICAFCAMGMPVFQYEPMRFFSVVYFSLLANMTIKK